MPMIVDPSAPHVTPPTVIESPDGWLTAVIDPTWAGVVLGYDARGDVIARNRVLNPSFELSFTTATDGYGTSDTRSRTGDQAFVGAFSVQHAISEAAADGGTSWDIDPASNGETLQWAVWVKIPDSGMASLQLWWRNGTTNLHTLDVLAQATPSTWSRVSGAYTLAAGETCDRVAAVATAGTVPATWWADAAMVEVGDTLHEYVDGAQENCVWEGEPFDSPSAWMSSIGQVDDVRQVRIVRQDPGAAAPVPVRSADSAWAVGGVGVAYDHEAPLGVAVVYTATPVYADGSEGPESALAVTVPAPDPGLTDVWIKSLDTPGLSAQVTVTSWPELAWAARIDQANPQGGRYPMASQDVYTAATSTITLNAAEAVIEQVRDLLTTPGVYLVQTLPSYHRPDQFVMFSDPSEAVDAEPDGSRTFTAAVVQVARPDTAGQPMRMPNWSYDEVAARYDSYDTVAATFDTYQALATNGVLT